MSLEEIQTAPSAKKWAANSFAISVIAHAAIAVLAVFIVAMVYEDKPQAEFSSTPPPRPRMEPRKLEMKVRANQLQRRSSRPKLAPRLAAMTPSQIALPEIKKFSDSKQKVKRNASVLGNVGNGLGIGGGFGDGLGGGGGGFGLPQVMQDRCNPASRMARLQKSGGDARAEAAVTKGLTWLAGDQNSDGSFGQGYKVGMTGLALLAFLGHCETPDSPQFGVNVSKALEYLIGVATKNNGELRTPGFNHWGYEHAIATYALCEAYTITRMEGLKGVVAPAVQRIVYGQSPDGGWRYQLDKKESDLSVAAWCIQALKAAHLTGLNLPDVDKTLDEAIKYVEKCTHDDGGVGYMPGHSPKGGLDGAGVLCMQIWKKGEMRHTRKTLERIVKRADQFDWNGPNANLYAWYYETQACFQRGGSHWTRWNNAFQMSVIGAQGPDGSWPATGGQANAGGLTWYGGGGNKDARVYRTALAVLMLEVYYRYLPSGA